MSRPRAAHHWVSRRALLVGGAAAGAALFLPTAAGAAGLVDPYSGAVRMVFPLASGTYRTPLADNWHAGREGTSYGWSHRTSKVKRAHDGVDVYPLAGQPLPSVWAPWSGTVAAVWTRSSNSVGASVTYKVSATHPPPWDYSRAVDDVAGLPLYGNFVWLRSTEPASAGYFAFFCHLQNDATIQGLAPDHVVGPSTALGRMGDSGNAAGTPQLHVELHYPAGAAYRCSRCAPRKSGLTAIDPHASLAGAAPRA